MLRVITRGRVIGGVNNVHFGILRLSAPRQVRVLSGTAATAGASGSGMAKASAASSTAASVSGDKDTNKAASSSATSVTANATTTTSGGPSASSAVPKPFQSSSGRPKLVVLGCGWASFKLIKDVDREKYDVHIISPRNHFVFTPLLASTTVGTLEFRNVIEPVRRTPHVTFQMAKATSLDPQRKVVTCYGVLDEAQQSFDVPYDVLAIGVGGNSATLGIKGVVENAHFLKEVSDARWIRQRVISCFEMAGQPGLPAEERNQLLQFVVVGGGPTGVEFAGELYDFVSQDLKKYFPSLMPYVKVTLLEAGKEILSSFDSKLKTYAQKILRQERVDLRLGTAVTEVKEGSVVLKSGEVIPCGLVVWSTGIAPRPFVESLQFPKSRAGRLLTDDYLRVLGQDNIFAFGDCATGVDREYPATAQVAQQKGKYLADTLNHLAKGENPKPFHYSHKGMLAYVGGYRALADTTAAKFGGIGAWLFWRSAYLTNLVSIRNKVMVPWDWLKTFVIGRDISSF